jgi:DNA-binding transcriptional ArsR family regulator
MTLFAMRDRDSVLAVRFAVSPLWETQAAVQALADERGRAYHGPWLQRVRADAGGLDLAPLLAVLPRFGYVPDFLTPPPAVALPAIAEQLDQVRATDPVQVADEIRRCIDSRPDAGSRQWLESFLADPERARDQLADLMQNAWTTLVEPHWARVRSLLERDIAERSRMLAAHGLRHCLAGLHPKIRWTDDGVVLPGGCDRTVKAGRRGLLLMPSAYLWPNVAAIVEEPWQPTIVYPAGGIAELWRSQVVPDSLARLLGRTRARILTALDQPVSTTAVAAMHDLSPAGASRHLLALRDAGLAAGARHGHEVRYRRTELGSALLHANGTKGFSRQPAAGAAPGRRRSCDEASPAPGTAALACRVDQ